MAMIKLEAVILPSKLDIVKTSLIELGLGGMTVYEVHGHGRQDGRTHSYRGSTYTIVLLPAIKIELVVHEDQVETVIDVIVRTAATGKDGDGKIFLTRIDDLIRIRNQQRGVAAL